MRATLLHCNWPTPHLFPSNCCCLPWTRKHIMSSIFTSFTALEKILISISAILADIQSWHLYRFKLECVSQCWSDNILMESQGGKILSYWGKKMSFPSCIKLCFYIVSWLFVLKLLVCILNLLLCRMLYLAQSESEKVGIAHSAGIKNSYCYAEHQNYLITLSLNRPRQIYRKRILKSFLFNLCKE